MMNLKQAEAIFEREAVLIGRRDVIPRERCEEITGVKLCEWRSFELGKHFNMFGIGHYQFHYYTKSGFLEAVTVINVREHAPKGVKFEDDHKGDEEASEHEPAHH